jgi:hypothetical protein
MTAVIVGVICFGLGVTLGRWWANKAVLLLLDKLNIGQSSNATGERTLPAGEKL